MRDTLDSGPLLGYPVNDVKASLIGGSFHEDDSTEIAFGIAAGIACRQAAMAATAVLLEPLMELEVMTPEQYLGDVIGDLNTKRASIEGVQAERESQSVKARVPLGEMFGYMTDLRSATQGRATFTMQFKAFAQVPEKQAAEIIKKVRGI